jgi:hypothetical protein
MVIIYLEMNQPKIMSDFNPFINRNQRLRIQRKIRRKFLQKHIKSAIKIQSIFRGYLRRKVYKKIKERRNANAAYVQILWRKKKIDQAVNDINKFLRGYYEMMKYRNQIVNIKNDVYFK